MESEKVEEIKKALKYNVDFIHHDKMFYVDDLDFKSVTYADILTYINELESEIKTHKDRIAELENGIAKSMLGCEFLPECTNDKLKQFSRIMAVEYDIPYCKIDKTLKEFLKE